MPASEKYVSLSHSRRLASSWPPRRRMINTDDGRELPISVAVRLSSADAHGQGSWMDAAHFEMTLRSVVGTFSAGPGD